MSKQLNITVAAPAHSGALGTALLVKVLLANALPSAQIELADETGHGNTAESISAEEAKLTQQLKEAATIDELNALFAERGVVIRIVAQNSAD